jgi:hypothetical protein
LGQGGGQTVKDGNSANPAIRADLRKVDNGFRKRSCLDEDLERDADSTENHQIIAL